MVARLMSSGRLQEVPGDRHPSEMIMIVQNSAYSPLRFFLISYVLSCCHNPCCRKRKQDGFGSSQTVSYSCRHPHSHTYCPSSLSSASCINRIWWWSVPLTELNQRPVCWRSMSYQVILVQGGSGGQASSGFGKGGP